jgi:hypothetical protein
MKLAIRELLMNHYLKTGEYVTQKRLAEEMLKEGLFTNIHSAQNMIQYNMNEKSRSVDFEILKFLCKRFDKKINEIII